MNRILVAIASLAGTFPTSADEKLDFSFDVQPILSDRCYKCHGTDEKQRKKELRLDVREKALKVIKPGAPDGSELISRIFSTDPDEMMPPPESKLELSAAEKELLKRWVAEGAEYKGHWAFQPLERQRAERRAQHRNETSSELDAFVRARLEQHGLTFNVEAPRERLLRRLSFDLTGLPPTIEELDAFLGDSSAQACEKQVDRLLASPAFGERMAADWLDVARFADTFGYQADVNSQVWPYRDYVIKALNENRPFDEFITEQLAGDLLPNASREQRVATAFNRLHRQTNEGGSIEEEFRVEYVCDRVQTFGVAFLGLTLECARCHDHKYDPIKQREFYQLFAFFNNIDESGLYSHFTDAIPTPTLRLTTPEQEAQSALNNSAVAQAEARLALLRDQRQAAFEQWRDSAPAAKDLNVPGLLGHFPFEKITDGKLANAANSSEPGAVSDDVAVQPGKSGNGLLLSGENNVNFSLGGQFTRDDAFSLALWIKTPDVKERAVIFHRSKAWTDAASCGYELLIEEGRLGAALVHFWPGNAMRVHAKQQLPLNQWTHVTVTYDGSSRARGLKIFLDGREADCEVVRDSLTKDINRGGENRLTIGQRFRDRGFKGGSIDEFRIYNRALSPLEVRLVHGQAGDVAAAEWKEYYLDAVDEDFRQQLDALKELRRGRSNFGDRLPELMTMRETPDPKPAFVLFRGAYDQRREPVLPDTPAALPPMPASAPKNRLGLAQWVTAPDNPLTARVIVNRLWQSLFGRGLVATPEDFGLQGQLPTHPQVLDGLARHFIDSGWDFKALVKTIVMSRTYRQDSTCSAEVRAKDPNNNLLSRGARFRLSAEQIRDNALASAGMLDRSIGGPSVDPDKTHRRSLYTFWKRTMADVRMEIFDMAQREVCVARRQQTNTPLQALTLLNEPRFNECAQKIAEKATVTHPQEIDARLVHIFRLLTSRQPSDAELEVLRLLHAEQKSAFAGDETAATTAVAVAVMNFDECVVRR
ncbi:MAG: DUF1553 domain-containing protein [Verrucomicrobiales bacterium]